MNKMHGIILLQLAILEFYSAARVYLIKERALWTNGLRAFVHVRSCCVIDTSVALRTIKSHRFDTEATCHIYKNPFLKERLRFDFESAPTLRLPALWLAIRTKFISFAFIFCMA